MSIKIETFDQLGSTNDYFKEHPELWEHDFYTVRAINQTSGRGRQQRKWVSRDKLDLTFSTIFHNPLKNNLISIVTLYAGLAVYRTLKKYLDDQLYIKWPNDLYYAGKKLCGILCESILYKNESIIIVGIGVNINSTEFSAELKDNSISMKMIKGTDFDIDLILDDISKNIVDIVPLITNPIKKKIMTELQSALRHKGVEIEYYSEGMKKRGKIIDINENGNILILDSETGCQVVYSGELVYI